MVKLVNIGHDDTFIWSDYIINGKGDSGFVKIEKESGNIKNHTQPDRIDYNPWFLKYAIIRLMEIKDLPKIPDTASIAWY